MRFLSIKLFLPLAALLGLQPWAACAQEAGAFPGMPVDAKLLRVQDQAEEIFERTEYDRAYFIYRNELAPIGDKYAQYMVGFMHLTGKGAEEDRAVASAWYRLAAERGTREFVGARDALLNILDDEQRARSDQLYLQIRKDYSDLTLMVRAARKEMKMLRERTGSRAASSDTMPMTVISASRGRALSGADYYKQIAKRLRSRLEYIGQQTGVEIQDANLTAVDLNAVEERVNAYLQQLD